MKSTLPLPAGRVTSNGTRPHALRIEAWTASTSLPGRLFSTAALQ
jgi:hypothetical protein